MKKYQKYLQWNSLAQKNFLNLLKGSALSQIIILAATPLITRIYSPGEIGEFLFIFFIAAIIGESSTLRLESALFVENKDRYLVRLKGSILVISFLISAAAFPFVFSFLVWYEGKISANPIITAFLISTISFLFGARHTIYAWVIRSGETRIAAQSLILKAITLVVLQITLGLYYPNPKSLLIAEILSTIFMLIMLNNIFKMNVNLLPTYLNRRMLKWNIKKYIRFVAYETPSHFMRSLVGRLPIIMITLIYGSEKAGLYGFTYQIVQLPNRHIGGNMGDIIQMEAGKIVREGEKHKIIDLFQHHSFVMTAIAIVPLITIILLAPWIFPLVLGAEWKDSAIIAQILAPWMFIALIVPTISRILLVIERQDIKFVFDGIMLITLLILFLVSYLLSFDFLVLLSMITASFVLIYMIYFAVMYKILKKYRLPK